MQVAQSIRHLIDVSRTPPLRERSMFAQLFIKLAFAGELQHQEYTLLVMKVAVQSKDIWVSQILLDFDLAADLLLDSGFNDFRFVEAFESEDVFGFAFGSDHIDSAKLTLAEWAANIERVETPFASGAWSVQSL